MKIPKFDTILICCGFYANMMKCSGGLQHDQFMLSLASLLMFLFQVEKLGKDSLVNCAKTSMSSKLIAGDSDFFANLVCHMGFLTCPISYCSFVILFRTIFRPVTFLSSRDCKK